MAAFFDRRINPKIMEIIRKRKKEHANTFTVVTVPNNRVPPCSDKNCK
jgi:hypothetical protein